MIEVSDNPIKMEKEAQRLFSEYINLYAPFEVLATIPIDSSVFTLTSEITGTYIIFNGNQMIYVGCSTCIGKRLNAHVSNYTPKSFSDEITHIKIVRCKNWEESESIEAALINEFKPKYNKNIPPMNHYVYRLPKERAVWLGEYIQKLIEYMKKEEKCQTE